MIIVDCKDVLPIQHELLVHVADHVKAIPSIKYNECIISPIENEDKIEYEQVKKTILEYLKHRIMQGVK